MAKYAWHFLIFMDLPFYPDILEPNQCIQVYQDLRRKIYIIYYKSLKVITTRPTGSKCSFLIQYILHDLDRAQFTAHAAGFYVLAPCVYTDCPLGVDRLV